MSQSQSSLEAFSRAVVSQRIAYVDSYTSFPIPEVDVLYSQFRSAEVKRVPVIRIYGPTIQGQKACVHVHGVFPYLYIELDSNVFGLEERLAEELDREISASLLEFNSKTSEHVYKIIQVTGRSFYGYQQQPRAFLKIFFYSPIAATKAINILQSGKILGQRFQPYEAHIPYILQFFLDFKLHGMNFIHFSNVKFRGTDQDPGKNDSIVFRDLEFGVKVDLKRLHRHNFLPAKVSRRSRCELEFDVTVSDIIQSHSTTSKNPGIEAIWMDERERRRKNGIDDWADVTIPASQDRPHESFVFKRETELREMLQSKLALHMGSVDQRKGDIISTPPHSYRSTPTMTPSSQVLVEDVAMINAESPAVSQSQSLEWNEEDEEMVSILENLARNRGIEEEEDSIMSSQVLADFDNDPTMSFDEDRTTLGDEDEDRNLANNDEVEDETLTNIDEVKDEWEDDGQDWGDDSLSPSAFQFLDKCENEALQQGSSSKEFKLNQVDGQFDSSDEDDDEFVPNGKSFQPLPNQLKRFGLGLPVAGGRSRWLGKMRSAEDVLRKPTSFVRTPSNSYLPPVVSPNNSRAPSSSTRHRASSPPIISSSSDDDDKVLKKKTHTVNVSPLNTPAVSPCKIQTPRKRSKPTSVLSPIRSLVNLRKASSPPIISSCSSGNDSDETNYVPSDNDIPDKSIEVDDDRKLLTTTELEAEAELIASQIEEVEEPRFSMASQNGIVDSGIRSFYRYPGEDFSQLINDDSEVELHADAEGSPSQPSQTQSINSFYEYSDMEDETISDDMDTSFLDVCMSQLDSSSENEEFSPSQRERTNFTKIAQRSKLKLKQERESLLVLRDSFCPSSFSKEVVPLKNPPSAYDVESRLKIDQSGVQKSQEEPSSLKYFRQKLSNPGGKLNCDDRRNIITEICSFKEYIQDQHQDPDVETIKSPQVILAKKPTLPPDFSDSDSDESQVREVRGFRFGGSRSDGEDELSSDISDNESEVAATPPQPPPSRSKLRTLTPKSGSWIARKRRRLNWGSQETSQSSQPIPPSLDESELDSISFTSSQSPGALNSSNYQDVKALQEHQFLCTMSMEVHCAARGLLTPDPTFDPIRAIFYFLHGETADVNYSNQQNQFGCLMVTGESLYGVTQTPGSVKEFEDELSMIKEFIKIVHETDPDILVGYEICRFSWGYLIDRGRQLELDMTSELSRLLPFGNSGKHPRPQEQWNESISGRIVLNLWRLLRHEMTVTSYTFENAVFQILHERVHLLPYRILAEQWETLNQKFKVISYFKRRVVDVIRIIEKLDLINRTSELARLFGIQFFEVLSRGSQFRVESMMLRLAKAYNLIPPSPSPPQRASMKAPEYLPLIMEPESRFYKDPVAVLDFQSLYPSMMMAYNYCFSSCIGRVNSIVDESSFEFGCLSQNASLEELNSLYYQDLIHISPCGVAFVKESVRKGVLGEMLEQILDTRQMVKRAMKKWKNDATLQKVLDSRQLGLKLIANVTYGYTSANYSGRMPCVEIADSVVSKGRETLQRAIDFVKENEDRFHGKVVYGDTDSLFIHFPGMTRAEAFKFSQQIVDEVTAANPKPVKLKLEKVYQPCILQTKKRYVGYAYETPDQYEPKYDAKGIETVRRDGCPATAQILKGALKMLFVTQDEGKVKAFVQEQFRKIFMGRVSLSKYTFAREYRGRAGYKPTAVVPSLEIAKRLAEKDPRAEPLQSQRVPYIVVYGDPNLPLIQLIRRPEDFIGNPNLRLNAHYYIEKAIIPPLNRCFSLARMDVSKWYDEMPRKYLKSHYAESGFGGTKKGTIDQYFVSESCVKCECRTKTGFCDTCFKNVGEVKDFLNLEEMRLTQKFQSCCKICNDCSNEVAGVCINMDCPVKHRYLRYDRDYTTKLPKLQSLSQKISLAMSSW